MFCQVFGKIEDKLAFLTEDKSFSILKIIHGLNNLKLKKIFTIKITGIESRIEKGISFSICDKNKYAFVHLYEPDLDKNKASSIAVFKIEQEKEMMFIAFVDLQSLNLKWFAHNFSFVRYFGDWVIVIAVEFGENAKVATFVFDSGNNEIFEVEGLRGDIRLDWIEKLGRDEGLGLSGLNHDNTQISIRVEELDGDI